LEVREAVEALRDAILHCNNMGQGWEINGEKAVLVPHDELQTLLARTLVPVPTAPASHLDVIGAKEIQLEVNRRMSEKAEEIGGGSSKPSPSGKDVVFDQRHDSECNWRVHGERCDCWLLEEECDENMASDISLWPPPANPGAPLKEGEA
jgi:hypothetical protein